jgi:hypothetical protein
VTSIRSWLRQHLGKAEGPQTAREQLRAARGLPASAKHDPEAASDDPIKNWETPDQAFLRQAGDPSL